MAAIDSDIQVFAPAWQFGRRKTTLALAGTALALVVAIVAFLVHGRDANAMRFAAQTVFRASTVPFLLFYLATPLGHLLPSRPTLILARERVGLALAFAGMYAVFLGCAVAPDYFAGAHVPLPTLAFAAFSAVILAVVLAGERAAHAAASWRPALRTMEIIGVAYFWAAYGVNDLDHLSGPHRPDGYYGISLTILVLALFVRFADSFWQRYKYARR
jgi:hypothetical protein